MGAGYGRWSRGGGYATRTTKGVGQTSAEGGWGIVPVVEGQIDTSNLAPGTYVLKLTPGAGTNVLRGDVDLVSAPDPGDPEVQAFAVPANQVVGDEITFVITNPSTPPVITAAQSVKTHGAAGDLSVDIPVVEGGSEPRDGGPTQLVVTFDQDVQGVGGLDVGDVVLSDGNATVTDVSITGNVLTVGLTGVSDSVVLMVMFPGIENSAGQACADTLCIRVLMGDTTGDGAVNIFDLVNVRNELGQQVTATNCRADVNVDGSISVFDLVAVRNQLNKTVAACQ